MTDVFNQNRLIEKTYYDRGIHLRNYRNLVHCTEFYSTVLYWTTELY